MYTVAEYVRHFESLGGGWVDPDKTTDQLLAGDVNAVVQGVAVAWMPYTRTLRRALELGCTLVIIHEPLYYNGQYGDDRMLNLPPARVKRMWIENTGLAVYRCHDLWDQFPQFGVPDAWGQFLGLGTPIEGEGLFRVYDVTGETAESLARRVATRTATLGQPAVELLGPPGTPVTRLVTGTGTITPFTHYLETYAPDVALCTDDGFTYWREGALATDLGMPVIVVNHAVSEMHGMELLATYVQEHFPEAPVHYIPQGNMYALVTGEDEQFG